MLRGKRRYTVFVLLLVALVLVFGGCGKKKDVAGDDKYSGAVYPENGLPRDQKVVLKIIYPEQGTGSEFIEQAMESFTKKFPNVEFKARYIESGKASYFKILESLIQANDDKGMFDWFESIPEGIRIRLIANDKLENQDEVIEMPFYDKPNIKIIDGINCERREVIAFDGHCYIIPNSMGIVGLFYNRGLFKKLGLEERPSDWDEFLEVCNKIKEKRIYPMVMPGKFPGYFLYGWGAIPYEIEGDYYRDAEYYKKPDLYLYKGYVVMLERLEEFSKKGYLHPGTVSFDHTQAQMEFIQGKAAMITNGTWIANEMKEVIPQGFEWGFMPFPGNEPGKQQVVLSYNSGQGYIWKNRPETNKKWAKEFNRWLLNLNLQKIIAKNGAMPVRKDFPTNFSDLSPSLRVAMEAIEEKNIQIVNNRVTARVFTNPESAKLGKVKLDSMVAVVTGKMTAETAARKTNAQYMKGLQAERR